jgi:hypothetical protein
MALPLKNLRRFSEAERAAISHEAAARRADLNRL